MVQAFASAVRQKYRDHVRLSIHPSTGASKLSISTLPTTSTHTTPWHCAVAVRLDGTVVSGMRSNLASDDDLELVYENGRPSFFREKSHLFTWGEDEGGIDCVPMYPSGWMITPAKGPGTMHIGHIDAAKVRALAEINSPVVMRGFFRRPREAVFFEKSKEFGTPLPWKFGYLLKVMDRGADTHGLNNVLSSESMPFHYDGLFKTASITGRDGKETIISMPPRCVPPPPPTRPITSGRLTKSSNQ